jgi:hypothetical protein
MRPSRVTKSAALQALKNENDDDEFVCPPPLMHRLKLIQREPLNQQESSSTSGVTAFGRGLLSFRANNLPGEAPPHHISNMVRLL